MERAHTHVNGRGISFTGLLAFTLLATPLSALAEDVGSVALVVNQAESGGKALADGAGISTADTVRTGAGSAALLAMADGTELAVGPQSELTLEDFINQAGASIGKFTLDVVSGAMRFATGTMDKSAYTIRTPSAVAAVRGTIFSIYVTDLGETYIAVEEGTVVLRSRKGTKFTVPAGASMFLNKAGEVDGALFDPLQGSDLSGLPKGDGPTDAVRTMDSILLGSANPEVAGKVVPRALGLPNAIEKGIIDPSALPPFATKTPAYGKSKLKLNKNRENGGSGY